MRRRPTQVVVWGKTLQKTLVRGFRPCSFLAVKTPNLEPILRKNLLALARAYRAAKPVSMRTLSLYAHGDRPFFERIAAKEGSFTIRKYDDVVAWFRTHRPPGMRWPKLYEPWAEDRPAS